MRLVSAAAGVLPPPGVDGSDPGSGDDCGDSDCGDADTAGAPGAAKAAWGQGSRGDARRWRDQERRNEGLREELTRQRVAFKVGRRWSNAAASGVRHRHVSALPRCAPQPGPAAGAASAVLWDGA